jgi:hypothetical protein
MTVIYYYYYYYHVTLFAVYFLSGLKYKIKRLISHAKQSTTASGSCNFKDVHDKLIIS